MSLNSKNFLFGILFWRVLVNSTNASATNIGIVHSSPDFRWNLKVPFDFEGLALKIFKFKRSLISPNHTSTYSNYEQSWKFRTSHILFNTVRFYIKFGQPVLHTFLQLADFQHKSKMALFLCYKRQVPEVCS